MTLGPDSGAVGRSTAGLSSNEELSAPVFSRARTNGSNLDDGPKLLDGTGLGNGDPELRLDCYAPGMDHDYRPDPEEVFTPQAVQLGRYGQELLLTISR